MNLNLKSAWMKQEEDPLGRLYVAAVVLPKDDDFHHEWMKDSKKFHSKKKIKMVSDYIKEHALAWTIQYIEHDVIDTINIRQAVHRGMHKAIQDIFEKNDIPKSKTLYSLTAMIFAPSHIMTKSMKK